MVTTKISALEAAKAKVAKLEQAIAAQLNRELAALPGKYGFDSVDAFVKAVKGAAGGKRGRPAGSKNKAGGKKRRTRAVITDAMRSEVKKLVEAGKTGAEIAKTVGISLPSVHNVKKALGLVEKRKK
jgi:hypothetical protein